MRSIKKKVGSEVAALLLVLVATIAIAWAPAYASSEVDAHLSSCVDNIFARFLPFEHVNRFLPSGFRAADASVILGLPAPVGFGLVVSPAFECGWSEVDQGPVSVTLLLVSVETPTVEGLEMETGTPPGADPLTSSPWLDLYLLAYYGSGESTGELLQDVGFPWVASTTRIEFAATGTAGTASLDDSLGSVATFDVVGAVAESKQFNVRFWHESGRGLGFFQYRRSQNLFWIGEVTACSLRAGGIHATVLGTADCTTATSPSSGFGGVFSDPSSFDGAFRFMEGVRAEPVR